MKRLVYSLALVVSLVALAQPVSANAPLRDTLYGNAESIDRAARTLVIDGVRVLVPRQVRGFRQIENGDPVSVELDPDARPPRARRIQIVPH